ncbi:hypothetical protein ACWD0J_27145 [Streptomyces sp. NPDC003011]
MYRKSSANTVDSARIRLELIVNDEIDRALRERHPDEGTDACAPQWSPRALGRPLRMTIHLALDDLDLPGPVSARVAADRYTTLQANTVGEAKAILSEALETIDAELRRRPAHGRRRRRVADRDRPLRTVVHYDLDDLDRDGPLDVNECWHMPYDGVPPGLQPRNCHPEYAAYDRPRVRHEPQSQPRRTLLQRILGG